MLFLFIRFSGTCVAGAVWQEPSPLEQAWKLLNEEDFQQALDAFTLIINDEPRNVEAYMGKAFALERMGYTVEAGIVYQTVIALDPDHIEARLYLSLLYIKRDMYDQAIKLLSGLIEASPQATNSLMYELGPAGGVEAIHTTAGRSDLFLYHRARAYRGAHELDKADRDISRALKARPDYPQYLHEKALLLEARSMREEALDVYDKLLAASPGYTPALYNLTRLSSSGLSDVSVAISAYDKVIAYDSSLIEAWTNRGILYYEQEKYEEAENDLAMALKLDSGRVQSLLNLGMTQAKLGKYLQAIENFNTLLGLDPNNVSALLHLGNVYLRQRQNELAIRQYDRILEFAPSHSGALFNKGIAYFNMGNKSLACEYIDRAAEMGRVIDPAIKKKVCR